MIKWEHRSTAERIPRHLKHLLGDYPTGKLQKKDWESIAGFLLGVIHDNCNAVVWAALAQVEYCPDWKKNQVAMLQKEIDEGREWLDKREQLLSEYGVLRKAIEEAG